MKINAKSIITLKRCLAAKQLQAYANLCETMADFDDLVEMEDSKIQFNKTWVDFFDKEQTSPPISEKKLQNRVNALLKKYIPLARTGDLSFLAESEFQQEVDSISGQYNGENISEYISRSFEDYAENATALQRFQKAEQLLSQAIRQDKTGKLVVSKKHLEQYQNFMRRNGKQLKQFDDYTRLHTCTTVGHTHYKIYQDSFRRVCEINPELANSPAFSRVTPEMFDATIRGIYRPKEHLQDISELEEISDKYNTTAKILDSMYSGSKRFVDYNKKHSKKVILTVLAASTLVGGVTIPSYLNAQEYDSINIYNAEKQGYPLSISQETYQRIKDLREQFDLLDNSDETPTIQQFLEMNKACTETWDTLITEIVGEAYKEAHPDRPIENVETRYTFPAPGETLKRVVIEYEDQYGITKTESISNLKSPSIFANATIDNVISDFEHYSNEIIHDDLRELKNADTFEEKGEIADKISQKLDGYIAAMETIGAKKAIYKDGFFGSSITLENPEQTQDKTNNQATSDAKSENVESNEHDDEIR